MGKEAYGINFRQTMKIGERLWLEDLLADTLLAIVRGEALALSIDRKTEYLGKVHALLKVCMSNVLHCFQIKRIN